MVANHSNDQVNKKKLEKILNKYIKKKKIYLYSSLNHGSDNSPVWRLLKWGGKLFLMFHFSSPGHSFIPVLYALFEIEYHAVGDTWWQPLLSHGK